MATACDHIDHVRTQMPYTVLTAGVTIAAGYEPVAFGVAWWVAVPVGAALMIGIVGVLGRKIDSTATTGA